MLTEVSLPKSSQTIACLNPDVLNVFEKTQICKSGDSFQVKIRYTRDSNLYAV